MTSRIQCYDNAGGPRLYVSLARPPCTPLLSCSHPLSRSLPGQVWRTTLRQCWGPQAVHFLGPPSLHPSALVLSSSHPLISLARPRSSLRSSDASSTFGGTAQRQGQEAGGDCAGRSEVQERKPYAVVALIRSRGWAERAQLRTRSRTKNVQMRTGTDRLAAMLRAARPASI